jgi:uncharacterized protein (DUF924 family)
MPGYNRIIEFWIHETGPKGWYNGPPELDQNIRDEFLDDWEAALEGGFADWKDTPQGCLGYLILTDQFPRNMFRNDPRAFASDPLARSVSKHAIEQDFDLQVERLAQEFFYLPFEHSEEMTDQQRCIDYISTRMDDNAGSLLHARAHLEIIETFGRFPYRNKALGRTATAAEQVFLDQNGYQEILKTLQN